MWKPPTSASNVCLAILFKRGPFFSGTYEYDLVMTPDLVTQRHTQWYFFKVMGAQSRVEYTFRILNFLKPMSLYKQGMKVLFYSLKLAKKTGYGWVRVGTDIR